MSSLFDVPAQLALALSLAASAGGSGSARAHPVYEVPAAPTALDIFDLQTVDGPLRFSDALWFRALKESASGPDADDVAGAIFRTSGGRYYVPASAERRRILLKRTDIALAARIARAFAERNAEQMQQDIHRAPTAGELYIAHLFEAYLATNDIGQAITEVVYLLDAKRNLQRRPDASFGSYARWPKGKLLPHTDPWVVVPNLAVEAISKSKTAEEIETTVQEYFRAGVELVWLAYPRERRVHVYETADRCVIVGDGGALTGGTVLPGFTVTIANLFAKVRG